ncbi:Concanavalin A-like lectin/glucanases superfamily [Phytophthora infestans]|uniref:Concanavalin A-like lectin/glucanases superfamily n=1 Tax=Phytophthora infestans TaxID=4787 RepID=A0A833WGY5_PHYIN|nr:Concanavalin A-like lectin/glucanases superfamily [Phytophthora infestans]KAF4133656.1 Concanavalin A-like lectin/glucanases superfamily [Phytophthora infestans]
MALPASAASAICSFLTGLDAISLSHTSSFWLQHLSVSSYWQPKLPTLADPLHAAAYKALFLRSRSLGFKGLIKSDSSVRTSDSYQPPKVQLSSLRDTSFSFDVWFALLPEQPDGAYTGGILYGLQSVHAESRVWPKFHQQFVVISALGDLFCSVLDYRPVVKSNLQVGRWYHLALTYDHQTHRQDVYLDGEKLRSDTGTLHREMDFLKYEQVGTGCITANELHFPKPGHLGWYGFHGVIDDFRVWRGLLSAEDVATLSSGEDVVEKHLISSLKVGTGSSQGLRWNICAVRCSRPREGPQLHMATQSRSSRLVITRPEQLPADAVELLCSYLTGFDAFHLSHTNFWWLTYFRDEEIWKQILESRTVSDLDPIWKKQYMTSRSMVFRGLQGNDDRHIDSYAYLASAGREQPHPSRSRLTFLGSESFSFDLWFSLMPAADGEAFGGIIYGLQSSSRESRRWPHFHQQFVLVSSTGDLYCSILDSRPVVATKLDSNRWYHLALTYDNETQSQDVYLDGAKVHSSTGTLHNEWGYLTHEQIGTGCITAGSLHVPRPSYVGWYGFHGILDDFRVWNGKLLQDDVKLLARGGQLPRQRLRASVKTATTFEDSARPLSWVNVQLTMCTRPTEGKHMQLVSFQSSKQPNCTIS